MTLYSVRLMADTERAQTYHRRQFLLGAAGFAVSLLYLVAWLVSGAAVGLRNTLEALTPMWWAQLALALSVIGAGHILVGINRGDYWQCGFVIAKGTLEGVKAQGLDTIRGAIALLAPFLADRTSEILSFDDFRQLTVGVDRLVMFLTGLTIRETLPFPLVRRR